MEAGVHRVRLADPHNPDCRRLRLSSYRAVALAALLMFMLAGPAMADDAQSPAADPNGAPESVDRIFQDPLGGVVVNRTVTVLGKDFYRYFASYWREHKEASKYTISIYERPTARFGSEVWVLYRQQRMFHIFLPPARQATREISQIAVQHVIENISQRELERMTTRNPDLGPEEL